MEKKVRRQVKQLLPILCILIGFALVYFLGIYKFLSFDCLKTYHETLKHFIEIHPFIVFFLFMLSYIVVAALPIPGEIFLTIVGGYLFPLPLSTFYAVIAATLGATLIFLAAQTALRGYLKKKAGLFLHKVERAFQKNQVSYLLFLRFIPLLPFWIVNITAVFLGASLRTYIWTTSVGILPGVFILTLAGSGLEKIFETNQEFSANVFFNLEMKIALTLLGFLALLPILVKKLRKGKPL